MGQQHKNETVKRAAIGLALTVTWLLLLAAPASAHTVSGIGATDWKSVLTSVSPQVAGLTVKIVEDGSRIEIVNHGPEVLVFGYQGEDYLRVGPQGVFENLQSPSTYLNCSRAGCAVPAGINKDNPPVWKKISSGQTVRYHDHRSHWMGSVLPPDVARAPSTYRVEADWTINMAQGSTPIMVKGYYAWVPGVSPFPWLVAAAVLVAVGASLGLLISWGIPLAIAVVIVTINDIYHAVGIAGFWSGNFGYRLEKFFSGSYYSMAGWVLGLLCGWLIVRKRVDGLYAAVFAGGSAALFTGLLDFTVLYRSQAPFTASITIDRVTVVISLGLGLGVAIGALLAIRESNVEFDEGDYADEDPEDADEDPDDADDAGEENEDLHEEDEDLTDGTITSR